MSVETKHCSVFLGMDTTHMSAREILHKSQSINNRIWHGLPKYEAGIEIVKCSV
jgi:hypothetical protein